MADNPIVSLFARLISATDMAKGTGLSISECYKILRDPNAKLHVDTVTIVHAWIQTNVGPCARSDVFHKDNETTKGRAPYTTGLSDKLTPQTDGKKCPTCHLVVARRADGSCTNCS